MPHHTATLQNCDTKTLHHLVYWSSQHFESFFFYSVRCSAIWRQKAEAQSTYLHMIADTMA